MAGEWREVAMGELAEIFDGPHATPPKTSDGPIFLGISNLAQGRLNLANTEHLSEGDYTRWTRRVEPQTGDVVFSYETRLGEAASIPSGLRCCLGRRMGLLRARAGKVDKRFLLYAYLGPQFQETLRSRTIHGSTVDRIPLIHMPGFPIAVPDSIDEQRAIAYILGTLDDKIELNRRMNETLEAMARALFKSWFVDFDPVRAKAEGREPDLSKPIADLFPDRFEDSELGKVPKGWEVTQLDDLADIQGGKQLPTEECRPMGMFPVFGANGIMGYAERSTHKEFVIAFGRVGAYCGSVRWG
ncbi:MAG: restriction endonuclease subunit S, partial [Rubrobacteraceae bacterium]